MLTTSVKLMTTVLRCFALFARGITIKRPRDKVEAGRVPVKNLCLTPVWFLIDRGSGALPRPAFPLARLVLPLAVCTGLGGENNRQGLFIVFGVF